MANSNDAEPNTVYFRRELQGVCEQVDGDVREAALKLQRMVHRLKQPNLPGRAYGLPFRIYQVENGERTELVSLNAHIDMAKATFDALVKISPHREWELRWGMMTPRRHVPQSGQRREPVDGTHD